jgi:hypothetical protein
MADSVGPRHFRGGQRLAAETDSFFKLATEETSVGKTDPVQC